MWDECYKVSQNSKTLNSSSIALSLWKSSNFTHVDSTPLNLVAPCSVTRENDLTGQAFCIKTDFIFFLLSTSFTACAVCSVLPLQVSVVL